MLWVLVLASNVFYVGSFYQKAEARPLPVAFLVTVQSVVGARNVIFTAESSQNALRSLA